MSGDFNDVLNENEKRGGRIRENWILANFWNMVNNCSVVDLPYIGKTMALVENGRNIMLKVSWIRQWPMMNGELCFQPHKYNT